MTEMMQLISEKEYDKAFTLTSAEFQKNTVRESFEALINTDTGKALFTGFQSLSFDEFTVNSGTQYGTYYEYSGTVSYDNGDLGDILVRLVREDSVLKVNYFNIKVSPERVLSFQPEKKAIAE